MRYISLFSGALGLDLGLEAQGWESVLANELDKIACETICLNRPDIRLAQCDIRALDPLRLNRELGHVDVIVGGPPCQAFSTAGKRRSIEDDRGSLLTAFARFATSLQPDFIVLENVRGLLSAPLRHRPHAERGDEHPPLSQDEQPGGALRQFVAHLGRFGYHSSLSLYDASLFGAAQKRERVVLIAANDRVPHLQPTRQLGDLRTFGEVTAGLGSHSCLPLRPGQMKFLPLVPAGGNWRDLPKEFQPEALGGAFSAGGGRVGFLRRLAWDKPSPTLVTDPTMPATLLAHPTEMRALSLEEYKRIQGFPDDWIVAGSLGKQLRQIGNAVPLELGRAIARHIEAWRAGTLAPSNEAKTSRYRGTTELDLLAV